MIRLICPKANSNSQPSFIEIEDSGNTRSRQRDRSLWLFKKRVADTTEGEGLGPAVVELIPSTSSGLQQSPNDVPLMVVRRSRPHKM